MGTELVVTTDRVQKFFDDLEAQKAILSTSTKLFTTLSKHFNSLQDSLSQKSQSLESKIQSLESRSRETLESLDLRETSIPERESAAAARIEEQKAAALAEFEKSISGNLDLPETLKSFSRKMDPQGLLKFIISKRKESISLRTELVQAIAEAVDPPKLVLDALEGFLDSKAKKIGVTDKRWACGLLVQALFPEGRSNSGEKGPEFSRSVVERAARIADTWKVQMVGDSNGGGGTLGAAEAVMFVQMVIGFRLKEKFSEEFFRKLVMEHAARRDMAKLAGALEFGEKMGDVIDELVKNGKEIEAVYFASETGLTERFPPVSLLKSYLRNSKKNATTILRNGNNSLAATEESSTLELNSIKAIIKCVEDHKLESEFSLDSLRKRATHLEKAKAERKKSSAASSRSHNNNNNKLWYLVSIERETTCWKAACGNNTTICSREDLYCDTAKDFNKTTFLLNSSCPIQEEDKSQFDFGIFLDALQSGIVESSTHFPQKFFYCFWWGLRNLSSLGQNLGTSTYVWEICFAVFISIAGLVLFSFLIGNMQTYLQSTTTRLEEMRVKRRDAEQWMSHRLLPENLRERIRRYEQYKWQETRGVDEENLICNLPKDLRRDIKRHLCLALLMRVPMFEKMDEQLLDAMCDRLKPVLYTEESYIVREGDPVDEMLFIMRGRLLTMTTNGGRTGFFNSEYLKAGDFCGEELLTWALDPHSSSNLPISTRTVQALSEVEAFALKADDLKFVASQFRRLHSKQLRHTFRLYSQQWRTWAACFIQAAWRRHCKKKLETSLLEEENRLQDALAKAGASSPSLGATIYASRFAANILRTIRRSGTRKARVPERLPAMLLQKPAEPDFTAEEQ